MELVGSDLLVKSNIPAELKLDLSGGKKFHFLIQNISTMVDF